MNKLYELTIHEAHKLLEGRKISSVELTKALLERISAVEDKIRACVTVTAELALRQAEEADAAIRSGDTAPLAGVPVLIKDVICTRGIRTTCSSRCWRTSFRLTMLSSSRS